MARVDSELYKCVNKIENLLGPPNGCFSVSESMRITYLQTYRANTRGPGGPKKAEGITSQSLIGKPSIKIRSLIFFPLGGPNLG